MLNKNINQKLEFNSVSGLMCKSHPSPFCGQRLMEEDKDDC